MEIYREGEIREREREVIKNMFETTFVLKISDIQKKSGLFLDSNKCNS